MAVRIGRPVPRIEDERFLTGRGTFAANLVPENALRATFVRSTRPHAKIRSITTIAAAHQGVRVFTAADFALPVFDWPEMPGVDMRMARPFVADDVVRFVGEIVAVVLAETQPQGVDALRHVEIDYESLPAVADPESAVAGAVTLFPDCGTNVCFVQRQAPDGELFADCEVVIRGKLVSQRLAPSPLEARSTTALVDTDGRLTVRLSTQTPHQDRDGLARFLKLDKDRVRVIAADVGGSFGAKTLSVEDVLVAWLAQHTGRPVNWTEFRTESMLAMTHGRDVHLDFTLGGSRAGLLKAYKLVSVQNVGAYAGIGASLPPLTALMASGVYAIPRVEVHASAVVSNTTPVGAYRGAGRPEATQAIERALELFAAEIQMDSALVRRRNFIPAESFPARTATGAVYDSGEYEEALDKALASVMLDEWRSEQARRRDVGDHRQIGIGLSTYVEVTSSRTETEYASVEVSAEGGIVLRTGSFSHGQGHETTLAMIVADTLAVQPTSVRVIKGDTDEVSRGTGTYGSKSMQIGGAAAQTAALLLLSRAKELAAEVLGVNVADIEFDGETGDFGVVGVSSREFGWPELAKQLDEEGRLGELIMEYDFTPLAPTFPFGAHVAVVEVDTETGSVTLLRLVAVDDAGTLINPLLAEGQVHGGIAMGVAQALYEEVRYDVEANPEVSDFATYAFPSAADLPSFDVIEMETPTPLNSLGAKGIGESGTVGATPAVHNAVLDALRPLGVRDVAMPTTSERVWRAIAEAASARSTFGSVEAVVANAEQLLAS